MIPIRSLAPVLLALSACAPRAGTAVASGADARPPNIVMVFVDDMGYGDLGVTGNRTVPTPNLDRLSAEGTRFTQFYVNAPVCSPSRAALTTGMYPFRWGIHSFINNREQNRRRGMVDWLDPSAPTLARTLKQVGYATGHFGKWHMGGGRDVGDAPPISAYGFDESVTQFEGLGERYLWKERHTLNEQSALLGRGPIHWTDKNRTTAHYVDRAIDFMRRNQHRPFFLNLWPDDVHTAHLPLPAVAAEYEAVARDSAQRAFFGVLDEMDRQLGRLFNEVDRLGIGRETIILFTSDNGPTDGPAQEGAGPPGSAGGFRGRKFSLYEGGIREPLIVRWPGRVPAGRVDDQAVIAAMDLFPSLATLAGAPLPTTRALDGEDFSRALLGGQVQRRAPLRWFYINNPAPRQAQHRTPGYAIRDGRWKLLSRWDGSSAELYDLETDPGETTDLATRQPAITARLQQRVREFSAQVPEDVRRGAAAATPAAP